MTAPDQQERAAEDVTKEEWVAFHELLTALREPGGLMRVIAALRSTPPEPVEVYKLALRSLADAYKEATGREGSYDAHLISARMALDAPPVEGDVLAVIHANPDGTYTTTEAPPPQQEPVAFARGMRKPIGVAEVNGRAVVVCDDGTVWQSIARGPDLLPTFADPSDLIGWVQASKLPGTSYDAEAEGDIPPQ